MKILGRFSFLLKSSFISQFHVNPFISLRSGGYVKSKWYCFPSFEIVTCVMLLCLVDRCFQSGCPVYIRIEGSCLQGCLSCEGNETAHPCHDLNLLQEKRSVALQSSKMFRVAQDYRFGGTFPIFGRQLTKFNLSNIRCPTVLQILRAGENTKI